MRNGPYTHPGVGVKRKTDGRTTSLLQRGYNTITLREGDIVNRFLIGGDTVLFNRQPSLHKMSMMAHKIKVMPYETFRLNVVTTPYNADFDGDEMNMHVPQSLQTAAELKHIACRFHSTLSVRGSFRRLSPLFRILFMGIYRMTNDGVLLNKQEMMNILMYIESFGGVLPEPSTKKPTQDWTPVVLPHHSRRNQRI